MPRPNRHHDALLIETAIKLLPEMGVSGMSLQKIADTCGVNVGMFSYHFGTKGQFVDRVLEAIYGDLFSEAESLAAGRGNAVEKIRSILLSVAFSLRDHRKIYASLFQDLLNGEREVSRFLIEKMTGNFELLIPLIEEAQENGDFEKLPLRQAGAFCMASINMPTLVSETIERATRGSKKSTKLAKVLETQLTTDESIAQRVDLAIRALSTRKGTR